jgi:hypothetical protein
MRYLFFCLIFTSTGSQEVQSGLKDAIILSLRNFSYLVLPVSIPAGLLGVDVNMSIPGQPSTLPLHTLERAPCSQAHALLERHIAARKKTLETQGTPL